MIIISTALSRCVYTGYTLTHSPSIAFIIKWMWMRSHEQRKCGATMYIVHILIFHSHLVQYQCNYSPAFFLILGDICTLPPRAHAIPLRSPPLLLCWVSCWIAAHCRSIAYLPLLRFALLCFASSSSSIINRFYRNIHITFLSGFEVSYHLVLTWSGDVTISNGL